MKWTTAAALVGLAVTTAGCATRQRPPAGLLAEGHRVPDVTGVDQHGNVHHLRQLHGQTYVVYFYPKDQTPGCTREACAFRDVWSRYEQAGVGVFGVSSDTQQSHQRFAAKHELPFPLVADTDGSWAAGFGVSATLGLYQRVTFLVGQDGRIARVYAEVDPGVHARQVLEDAVRL